MVCTPMSEDFQIQLKNYITSLNTSTIAAAVQVLVCQHCILFSRIRNTKLKKSRILFQGYAIEMCILFSLTRIIVNYMNL